jgi:hypothetical protein
VGSSSSVMNTPCPLSETTISDSMVPCDGVWYSTEAFGKDGGFAPCPQSRPTLPGGYCRNFGISYASTQCAGCRETVMIRFHMVISGFTWLRLGYIRARSLIIYPYVFVAGPNKHDLFPCVNDQRKFQQVSPRRSREYGFRLVASRLVLTESKILKAGIQDTLYLVLRKCGPPYRSFQLSTHSCHRQKLAGLYGCQTYSEKSAVYHCSLFVYVQEEVRFRWVSRQCHYIRGTVHHAVPSAHTDYWDGPYRN